MPVKAPSPDVQRVIATALDAAFYRTVYEDIGPTGDAFRHYADCGWREVRDPAPWFSAQRYLEANPDVARQGVDPLHHYLTRGRYEGRDVFPSIHAHSYFKGRISSQQPALWSAEAMLAAPPNAPVAPADPTHEEIAAYQRALCGPEFDPDYYLGMNPDVAEAGTDPLLHFLSTGWREGRDPNPRFSVRDYLETYPDVAAAGDNPFVHYLQAGRAEGRTPRQDLGFRYEVLAGLQPVDARVARAAEATAAVKLGSVAGLEAVLSASRTGLRDLHVTFSHDDYTAHLGGVQLCLQREGARIARMGRDHLHLHPATAWPVVRGKGEPGALGVVWNGKPAGAWSGATIAKVLGKLAPPPGGRRSFAIHSLLGHSVDETVKVLAAVGLRSGFFWLHDFASLCAGFHLLRDDVEDCAAPPPTSAACNLCVYGPWRGRHLSEHEKLFKALDLTVVSPSRPTLDLWRSSWTFPATRQVVLPHAKLVKCGPAPLRDGPFRLGFAGVAAAHKGWPVFRDLALRLEGDPRYEFVHFGQRPIGGLPIGFSEARVTADRPKAMQEALEAAQLDAVLVWPLCRETFSFTAHEAVAAGAAVITNPDSGNVCAFVEAGRHGQVVPDEASLIRLFDTGEVLQLSRAHRKPALYDLKYSGLTTELLRKTSAAA